MQIACATRSDTKPRRMAVKTAAPQMQKRATTTIVTRFALHKLPDALPLFPSQASSGRNAGRGA